MTIAPDRIRLALREPMRAAFHVASSLAPGPFWRRYMRLSREQHLRRPYLLLSFDCETPRDSAAALEVREECARRGLPCAFAVPGEVLEQDADIYTELISSDVELINHGYRQHTAELSGPAGGTVTTFEYRDLSTPEVTADIENGDRAHRQILGRAPAGYRTPHFGSFQRRRDLGLVHGAIARLGYRYSTSTIPLVAFRRGPAPLVAARQLVELPVSGSPSRAHRVLDSWGYTADPDRAVDRLDLEREVAHLGRLVRSAGTGIVNVYGDPSQVQGWTGFFDSLGELADLSATFAEVARRRLRGR